MGVRLAGAAVLTASLISLLYEVQRTDVGTYAAIAGLVATIALASSWIPATQASRVDPVEALRTE